MQHFQVLALVSTLVCLNQEAFGIFRDQTAQSCLDYAKKGYKTNGFYQINHGNSLQTVYCDMESEPGSAWTLVKSFAFKNKALPAFSKRLLQFNYPVLPKTPNWFAYRMSLTRMNTLKLQSTHWRITCDFQNKPVDIHRDYALASFANFDLMTFTGGNVCKLMDYINVRGHLCASCTAGWYAYAHVNGGEALHFNSPSTGCQFAPGRGSVHSEDNFGLYLFTNKKFRCTSSPEATTNFWFGGYL